MQASGHKILLRGPKNIGTSLAERRCGTASMLPSQTSQVCRIRRKEKPPHILFTNNFSLFTTTSKLKVKVHLLLPQAGWDSGQQPCWPRAPGFITRPTQDTCSELSLHLPLQNMALPTWCGPGDSLLKLSAEPRSQNPSGISCPYRCSSHIQNKHH